MSKGSGLSKQEWRRDTAFPEKFIKEAWSNGLYITTLAKSESEYIAVASQTSEFSDQSCQCSESGLPKTYIQQQADKKYFITSVLGYGQDSWCFVMSKTMRYVSQSYGLLNSYPFPALLNKELKNGLRIQAIY